MTEVLSSLSEKPKVKVLMSTDVILECFTNFNGYMEEAEELLQLARFQKIQAYVTDYCLQRIGFYLSKPDIKLGEEAVSRIRMLLNDRIIYISRNFIEEARQSSIRDFDAAVEVICAITMNIDAIITQQSSRFTGASLSTLSTDDFVKRHYLEDLLHNSTQPFLVKSSLQDFRRLEESLVTNDKFRLNSFGINSRNNLTDLDLQNANLKKAYLSGANLRGADLRGADLQEANLTFAALSFAKLGSANLKSADLRGTNLSLAMLGESDLNSADLSHSNLSCADLNGAQLCEANLQGANLQGANLQDTNLTGSDLQGANLENAQNLQNANVMLARFGQNLGISEQMKIELMRNGAIFFEEHLGERSISLIDCPHTKPLNQD